MSVTGSKSLWAIRRLRHRFFSAALVLLYHRITEVSTDPWGLCVKPERFAEHLEILRKFGRSLHLGAAVEALREGRVPSRSTIITFDDGYADNLYRAKPLLERFDMPATVFVTTGKLRTGAEFWWDELDRLLLQPGTIPSKLDLTIRQQAYAWELGQAANYTVREARDHRHWTMYDENDPTQRHSLYRSIYRLLWPLPEHERGKVMDELVTWAAAAPPARASHRCLTLEELPVLAQTPLIDIGAHTVTHPVLSMTTGQDQDQEIRGSKNSIEEILGRPVSQFAYPFGGRGSYSRRTIRAVREAGFDGACSTVPNLVWQRTDPFRIPRIEVSDWNGEEFAKRLSQWFVV